MGLTADYILVKFQLDSKQVGTIKFMLENWGSAPPVF